MIHLQTIDKQSIGGQVLAILRENIMLGALKSGFHLKETVLSKELGVSRGPIREAIAQLENEGLVSRPLNGRTVVQGFSNKDLENLYNTRIELEKYAISQLSKEAIREGEIDLYRCIELMEEGLTKGTRDVDADLLFHCLIIQLTGNKTLIQLWKSLNGLIKTLIVVTTDYTIDQRDIIEEHVRIIKFLVGGNIEQAQAEIEYHLKSAREFYKKAIEVRENINKL